MKYAAFVLTFGIIQLVQSQNNFSLDLNSVKTELKDYAVGFAANYLKSYSGIERQFNSSKGFLSISPEISLLAGTSDAFSQLTCKLSGFFLRAKDTVIAGLTTLNSRRTMHLFPIAIGLETSTEFTFANTLIEAGYIPYYQAPGNPLFNDFIKHTQIGFFLQAGYKSKIDTTGAALVTGGKSDESREKVENGILRFKTDFLIDTKNFFSSGSSGIGFVGKANFWFDFVNGKSYYKIDGRLRIYLTNNKFFDFMYQKGSGSPNFNKGDQFGIALSIMF